MWESSEVKHGRAEGKVSWLMFASYFLDFHTWILSVFAFFFKMHGTF